MKANKSGIDFIKKHEALRLKAYRPLKNDEWTIGWGHTSLAGPPKVTQGMEISAVEAENILRADLKKFEDQVNRLVRVPLNQSQFNALLSFQYNSGGLLYKGKPSTLLKLLNAGKYDRVPNELSKWVYDNGKVINGLVKRRAEEAALFTSEDENDLEPAKNVTRAVPKIITKENLAFGAGIIGSSGISVDALIAGNSPVNYAIAGGIVAALVVGLVLFFKRRGS